MSRPHVDVDAVPLRAFALADEREPFVSGWHAHTRHQLLYAAEGALQLVVDEAQWLLPPQRGAWIRAGVRHDVRATRTTALRTVYFDPGFAGPEPRCCVFPVLPLAREMILYAMRWGPQPEPTPDPLAEPFFALLAGLCRDWARDARPWRLPAARSPELRRAMDHALEHLERAPTLEDAARAAALSPRTLARRFADEAATTWREFLHTARMLRAMDLLLEPGARVTDVALAVGFESIGAFSHAFGRFVGEPPSAFRARHRAATPH